MGDILVNDRVQSILHILVLDLVQHTIIINQPLELLVEVEQFELAFLLPLQFFLLVLLLNELLEHLL